MVDKNIKNIKFKVLLEEGAFRTYLGELYAKHKFHWIGCSHHVTIYNGADVVAEYIRDPAGLTWRLGKDVLSHGSVLSGNIPTGD